MFHDSVRVPEESGLGVARIHLSFDAWKAGHVAPATLEVPIVEPKPKPKAEENAKRPEPKVADSKELRQTLPHDGYIGGLAYTPDGRLLATLDWDNQGNGKTGVHLWDTGIYKKKATFPLKPMNSEAFSLQIDPTGKLLAVATREVKVSANDNRYEGWSGWGVTVWDITKGKEKTSFREGKPGTASVLAFDGNSILLSLLEGEPWKTRPQPSRVMHLNLASGEKTTIYESKERDCGVASVSPDRRLALLISRPSAKVATTEVHLLDLKTGKTRSLCETQGSVSSASVFTPDGKTAAVFLWNKLRFWDVATGQEHSELSKRYAAFWKRSENERLERITDMCYSPDGKLLAIAHEVFDIHSRRRIPEIVLWDLAAGEACSFLRGHTSYLFNMAFAPDGRTLATGSFDKTVKLWHISPTSKLSRDR